MPDTIDFQEQNNPKIFFLILIAREVRIRCTTTKPALGKVYSILKSRLLMIRLNVYTCLNYHIKQLL